MASVAVRSGAMVQLLLIYCFMCFLIIVEFCFGLCFGVHCFMSFLVLQSSWRWSEMVCCALIVFHGSCYCGCSVALPRTAVGWSVVYDCGIS